MITKKAEGRDVLLGELGWPDLSAPIAAAVKVIVCVIIAKKPPAK